MDDPRRNDDPLGMGRRLEEQAADFEIHEGCRAGSEEPSRQPPGREVLEAPRTPGIRGPNLDRRGRPQIGLDAPRPTTIEVAPKILVHSGMQGLGLLELDTHPDLIPLLRKRANPPLGLKPPPIRQVIQPEGKLAPDLDSTRLGSRNSQASPMGREIAHRGHDLPRTTQGKGTPPGAFFSKFHSILPPAISARGSLSNAFNSTGRSLSSSGSLNPGRIIRPLVFSHTSSLGFVGGMLHRNYPFRQPGTSSVFQLRNTPEEAPTPNPGARVDTDPTNSPSLQSPHNRPGFPHPRQPP